jgi:hypothetical protein
MVGQALALGTLERSLLDQDPLPLTLNRSGRRSRVDVTYPVSLGVRPRCTAQRRK